MEWWSNGIALAPRSVKTTKALRALSFTKVIAILKQNIKLSDPWCSQCLSVYNQLKSLKPNNFPYFADGAGSAFTGFCCAEAGDFMQMFIVGI